jgi:signal transduction histidine kinase
MRRAERALRTAARQWEATFDGIADGIALVARDLMIVRSNAAFRRILGAGHEAQQRLGDLWDGAAESPTPFVRVWKSARREVGDVSRDGRWYRLTVDPVIEDDVVVSAVCFVTEVTEVLRLERERQTRFDEAEAANRAKDDFLAVLGHELRTPLMPIALSMRALQKKFATDPDVTRARDVVERQVRHLTRLVDDLLDVARVTRHKLRLNLERLDLRTVVGDAIEAARPQIETRRHRLTVRLPETPVWVQGDPVRLGQIVVNLLTNAAKFTPAGGEITVILGRDGRDAVLRVSDNGVGIAPGSLPLIFEPFAQGAAPAHAAERGLGVGLALVRGLAEAHGGGASVVSDGPGRGSQFVVRLPLAAPDQPALALSKATGAGGGARVLVVEDEADSRTLLAEILRLDGHDVTATADGAEAVTSALARPPDVAIIDIGLRGMDGYEVARRLRQTIGGTIHLIAVTGYGQAEDIERSRAAGFDAHVTKPVAPDELLRLLGGWARR